jgi:hypothetical protein
MKKFYMTMAAVLFGATAMAQNVLYVDDITADPGTTAIEMAVGMNNSDATVTAVSFKIGLPEGLTLTLNKKLKPQATVDEDRMEDHTAAFTDIPGSEDKMLSVYSMNVAPFYENTGTIVTVPLTVAADGEYTVRLYDISIANTAKESIADATELTFKVTVGGTGINEIKALDNNAPIFNVAGQRVNKAEKGVYIQKGKKVAVK